MKMQRNDPCHCGSGKKYKKCCGQAGATTPFAEKTPRKDNKPSQTGYSSTEAAAFSEISQLIALLNAGQHLDLVEIKARELTARHPTSGTAWKVLGVALGMQGKDALEALQKTAELLSDDAEAHNNLGNALRSDGQFEAAAASCRRSLQINPTFAEAHNNLGNALRHLGQLDKAQACFHRALEIKPNLAQAHSNLGNVLLDLGQCDAAVSSFRRAVQLKPDLAEAHCNMSKALLQLEQFETAAQSCYQALHIKPQYAEAHNNLGYALLNLRDFDAAVISCRRAVEIKPNLTEAYGNLAIALRHLGRTAEAEASCHAALDNDPNYVIAITTLGGLRADSGQFSEAETLYKRAVSIEPDLVEAWSGIPQVRKMTTADTDWLAEAKRLTGMPLSPQREAMLHFAIGKYFDDVKDFDQAFAHYCSANELDKQTAPKYDQQGMTQLVDLITQSYNQEWLARIRVAVNKPARPVFIVGMPRSGTTLAEQILSSHPAVFGAGEMDFWAKAFAAFQPAAQPDETSRHLLEKLATDYLQILDKLAPESLYVIDKMPGNFFCAGLIHAALPEARIIHMRRNPVDTCLSIYFQNFNEIHNYANDLESLEHSYSEYRRLMTHWQSTLPVSTMLEVAYEDLVEDQEAWSRKMLEFIGLPWDARCLDFHQTSRTVGTPSKWQVRQKISKSSVERWRNYEKFVEPLLSLLNK